MGLRRAGCVQAIAGEVKTIVKITWWVIKSFPGGAELNLPIAKSFLSIVKIVAGVVKTILTTPATIFTVPQLGLPYAGFPEGTA